MTHESVRPTTVLGKVIYVVTFPIAFVITFVIVAVMGLYFLTSHYFGWY